MTSQCRVKITNVPDRVRHNELNELFSYIGPIDSILVRQCITPQNTQECFVTYKESVDCKLSLHLTGVELGDRAIMIVLHPDEIPPSQQEQAETARKALKDAKYSRPHSRENSVHSLNADGGDKKDDIVDTDKVSAKGPGSPTQSRHSEHSRHRSTSRNQHFRERQRSRSRDRHGHRRSRDYYDDSDDESYRRSHKRYRSTSRDYDRRR